ncbi:MAG: tetratricopeptide repeat protein, partial [Treponemataceae bacterium]|nr:tetratricopeptide repeat protein [Treponemataceae bacterium]
MADTLKKGIKLYNSGKYKDALAYFMELDPDKVESTDEMAYYIGLSFASLKKYDEALIYLEQVVTNGSDSEKINQCILLLAVIYSMTDRSKMAEQELAKLDSKSDSSD